LFSKFKGKSHFKITNKNTENRTSKGFGLGAFAYSYPSGLAPEKDYEEGWLGMGTYDENVTAGAYAL
jgi:hypothetical protein